MPNTTIKGGRVRGEGRVISVNAKYGFLAAQGINSKVFIIPSSLKMDAPFPALTDELHIDDLVTFEANEQAERNGAKYLAVDGSVKLKQRGKDVMVEGEGKIVRLDLVRGCFGFIDSGKVGSVFFNIAAVRPPTTDVGRVLKMGQKVKFRALPNSEQPNCKWRASLVCAFNKANEYLNISTNNIGTNGATSSFSNLHNCNIATSSKKNKNSKKSTNHQSGSQLDCPIDNSTPKTTSTPSETPPPAIEKIGRLELNDSPKNFSSIVKQSLENSSNRNDFWPILENKHDDDPNPAEMWDLYLEQQQKALNQNFIYNPPMGGGVEQQSYTQIRFRDRIEDDQSFFVYSNNPFLARKEAEQDSICRHIKNLVHHADWSTVNGGDEKCDYCGD